MSDLTPSYDSTYLQALFDEMQSTYERVSNITSFGFSLRWRRQLVALMCLQAGVSIGDLMAGGGETWRYVLPRIQPDGTLIAVDFSRAMVNHAHQRKCQLNAGNVTVQEENALCSSIPAHSLDAVICVYGVKTLSPDQQRQFVHEVSRILKHGGMVGLVEVSLPPFRGLRSLYWFYMRHVVPLVGKLLLGNPENYRMLSTYMTQFGDCHRLKPLFAAQGFDLCHHSFFWGCASALVGKKR
jgi:demethylmenaquinone methyltransferase/2-methoxy-6-polyprenyl-1,4-benzoquinol methylase